MKALLEQVKIFNDTHPMTSFEIQKLYLPKIKDGADVINVNEYEPTGTH